MLFTACHFNAQYINDKADKDGLLNILVKTQKILSDFKSNKIVEWKTNHIEGSNPSNFYHFVYEAEYQNYVAKETIDCKNSTTRFIKSYNEDVKNHK